jgi:hypothetical protein
VFVPAYLFPPQASFDTRLSERDAWTVSVARATRLKVDGLSLPPGRWRMERVGASASFEAAAGDAFSTAPRELIARDAPLSIMLRARQSARFEGVRLTRLR